MPTLTLAVELREEPMDGPVAQELLAAFFDEMLPRYPGWRPDVGPSAEPHEFRRPTGTFVVAYDEGRPVGCGGVKRLDDRAAEIKRVYVVPEARRTGVARRIVERLEGFARDTGYEVLRLDTGDQQPDAVALYRASGYREIADYNANPEASFWFEKELA
jgi:GNAT superfamily N-acetyltransferase